MGKSTAVVLVLMFASTAGLSLAPDACAEPTPNSLFQMQKSNRARPWLHIATDSGTITRRVKLVDRSGLYDLSSPDGATWPGPLLWGDIRRIDEVITRRKQMRMVGAVVVGLAAAGLGNALGAPDGNGGQYAAIGASLGMRVGGTIGGQLGGRHQTSERPWYVVQSPSPTDSAAAGGQSSDAILRACGRIDRNRLLRVRSRLGTFEGYAGTSGPEGLENLKARHSRLGDSPAPTMIHWDAIDLVEVRGGSSLRGAVGGGVALGLIGALLGLAAVSVAGSDVSAGEAAGGGFLYVAPVGFVLGGLGGMAARRWVVLYQRP
ncbi:MAG: hypothetical protein ABIU54_03915 [Candidatus Eisenbacteria bacterium]